MNFDCIVGNPPYQSATGKIGGGSTPLYIKFTKRCQEIVKNGGYIGLVTPPTAFKIGFGGYLNPHEVIEINLDAGKYFKNIGSSIWYFIQQRGRLGSTNITKDNSTYTITITDNTILTAENSIELSIISKIQNYRGGASLKNIKRNVCPYPVGAVFLRRMNRNKTFNALLTYAGMEHDIKLNQDYTLVHPHAASIVATLNSKVYTFLWQRYQTSPFITLEWIRSINVPIDNIYGDLGLTTDEIQYIEHLN